MIKSLIMYGGIVFWMFVIVLAISLIITFIIGDDDLDRRGW